MIAALALLLAACGESTAADDTEDAAVATQISPPTAEASSAKVEELEEANPDEPAPDVVVRAEETVLELAPYVYCWSATCVDGAPPTALTDIGEQDELIVEFPAPDWEFLATFWRPGGLHTEGDAEDTCVGGIELEQLSATTFKLPPVGPAGTYDVNLVGNGEDGDVAAAFSWTTTVDDGRTAAPC